MFVYLLKNETTSLFKIGATWKPRDRLLSIAMNTSDDLRPISFIATNMRFILEGEIHRMWKDKRRHGEWFELSEEDVSMFKSVRLVNYKGEDPVEVEDPFPPPRFPSEKKVRYIVAVGEIIRRIRYTGKLRQSEKAIGCKPCDLLPTVKRRKK